jgi:hypothetical protein
MALAYEQHPEFSDGITGLDSLENEIIKKTGSWVTWKTQRRLEPLK